MLIITSFLSEISDRIAVYALGPNHLLPADTHFTLVDTIKNKDGLLINQNLEFEFEVEPTSLNERVTNKKRVVSREKIL